MRRERHGILSPWYPSNNIITEFLLPIYSKLALEFAQIWTMESNTEWRSRECLNEGGKCQELMAQYPR